jgi:hypothetical protein
MYFIAFAKADQKNKPCQGICVIYESLSGVFEKRG